MSVYLQNLCCKASFLRVRQILIGSLQVRKETSSAGVEGTDWTLSRRTGTSSSIVDADWGDEVSMEVQARLVKGYVAKWHIGLGVNSEIRDEVVHHSGEQGQGSVLLLRLVDDVQ